MKKYPGGSLTCLGGGGAWLRKASFGHSQYGAQDRGPLARWGLRADNTA